VATPILLTLSLLALGVALQIDNGFYSPGALVWLTLGLLLAVSGVWTMSREPSPEAGDSRLVAVLAAGIAWQCASLLSGSPVMYLSPTGNLTPFRAGVLLQAGLIVAGLAGLRFARCYWFPALLAVQLALGVWTLRASPDPPIDVVVVHRAAFDALLNGDNPYDITFKNIYGANSGFYNPQAVQGDRVMFGYPYPPPSLLATLPGHLLAGDYRYAQLVSLVGAAGLIAYTNGGLVAKLAGALLLTTPRGYFVLEQGWTEPVSVLMLAATAFLMVRRPGRAGLAAGILIVTKQYLALGLPALFWFAARRRPCARALLGLAALAAATVVLPFFLWDPRAFIEQVVLLQTREPFRTDSLSYLSWAARAGWGEGSFIWAAAAGAVALIFALVRAPNTAAGFAAAIALSSFASFAFGSKAFCNYYFFVVAALACAVAAHRRA
jgi:hypothetical protein